MSGRDAPTSTATHGKADSIRRLDREEARVADWGLSEEIIPINRETPQTTTSSTSEGWKPERKGGRELCLPTPSQATVP